MRAISEKLSATLALVRVTGGTFGADCAGVLTRACLPLASCGIEWVLVDLSALSQCGASGLAGLVEAYSNLTHRLRLAFVGLPADGQKQLERLGLGGCLPCFATLEAAFAEPDIRRHRLRGMRAVVLCAGRGSRIAPLSDSLPKPMLDLMGKPVLAHILAHLGRFGLREVILNPGHLGDRISGYFHGNPLPGQSLFYLNEGSGSAAGWQAAPLGSASTLARLHHQHSAFDDDVFVFCGDALIDIDLADLLYCHRTSGAAATIAALQVAPDAVEKYGILNTDPGGRISQFQEKPSRAEARGTLANTGIYVFRADVLARLPDSPGQDIGADLLPALLRQGYHLQAYDRPFRWADIGCARDYVAVLGCILRGEIAVPGPVEAVQRRPGLWVERGAHISAGATIDGPCYVAPGARIEAGAHITGPAVIGRSAQIDGQSLIKNSVIWENTRVQSGAIVSHMIAAPDWAIDHRYADGSLQNRSPLERTCHVAAPAGGVDWTAHNAIAEVPMALGRTA